MDLKKYITKCVKRVEFLSQSECKKGFLNYDNISYKQN